MKITKLLQLAALLVGFAGGYYAVKSLFGGQPAASRGLKESVEFTEPLYRQYASGDYERAKAAMLAIVRHLEESEVGPARGGGEYRSGEDAVMAYARLAKLEETRRSGGGAEYMREAVTRCERLRADRGRARDCEESHLRAEVERTDALLPR